MPKSAEVKAQVERIWLATFQGSLAETVTQQVRKHALAGVQAALETALVEELHAYRSHWSAQQPPFTCLPPSLQRSGTSTRHVRSSYGCIPALHVPKLRGSNRERPWQLLTRYQIAMPDVLDQARYLYTLEHSMRDLQEAVSVVFGHLRSRDALNWVTLAAQSPMEQWRQRPIMDTPPILIVDGVWVQILAPTGQT
jgi:putative transposase